MIEGFVLEWQLQSVAAPKRYWNRLLRSARIRQLERFWIIINSIHVRLRMVPLDEHGVGPGSATEVKYSVGPGHVSWNKHQSAERIVRHRPPDQGVVQRTR